MLPQQTPEQLLECQVIQFDVYVDRLVIQTRENMQALCHAHRFPHPSNLMVSGLYKPMELARHFQTTYVARPPFKTLQAWHLKYANRVSRNNTISYFASKEDLGIVIDNATDDELRKLRDNNYRVIAQEPKTLVHDTGGREDVNRIYLFASPSNLDHLQLSQMYMNAIDDEDLHKTGMEFVVIMP